MKRMLLLSFALTFAAAASAAGSASSRPPESKPYYWWLHPKLGMVKVDRATNAMVSGRRDAATAQATKR